MRLITLLHRQKSKSETVTEDLASQFLNGVYVKGARVTTTIPSGTIGNDRDLKVVNERWYSDDLKLLLKSSNSDPRFGTTTYELTDISQVAPDARVIPSSSRLHRRPLRAPW